MAIGRHTFCVFILFIHSLLRSCLVLVTDDLWDKGFLETTFFPPRDRVLEIVWIYIIYST